MRRKENSECLFGRVFHVGFGEQEELSVGKRAPSMLCLRTTIVGLIFMLKMRLYVYV
jgi:hypothetical protein